MNAYGSPTTGSSRACAVASWIHTEALAHRMPAVVKDVEASFDDVILTICPDEYWQWLVWTNLLKVDRSCLCRNGDEITGDGVWDGVHVVLCGVDVDRWAGTP